MGFGPEKAFALCLTIDNPQKRNNFLATFAEIIGANAAAIAVEDHQLRWASLRVTHGMDRATIDSYCQYYVGLNPWARRKPSTTGKVRRSLELLSEAEFRETEFYHGWFKPHGWGLATSIVLDTTETERTHVFAVRPPNHPFTERELAIQNDLAPHLAMAASQRRSSNRHTHRFQSKPHRIPHSLSDSPRTEPQRVRTQGRRHNRYCAMACEAHLQETWR